MQIELIRMCWLSREDEQELVATGLARASIPAIVIDFQRGDLLELPPVAEFKEFTGVCSFIQLVVVPERGQCRR